MQVKAKYSFISEQFLFEFTLDDRRMNFNKYHYAFWMSIKDLNVSELKFDDLVRLQKIEYLHKSLLRRKR